MADEQKCLFCEIVKGTIPALKVYENEGSIAVLNIKPANKGQILIIPKQHHLFMHTMPDEVMFSMTNALKAVTTILSQVLQCPGISVLYNIGSAAGQKIGHVSFDVIPRYANDKVKIEVPETQVKENDLIDMQRLIVKAFQESTIKLLQAIKSGEIKVSDDVKKQAEKTLELLEKQKPPKNPLKDKDKLDAMKLEEELGKL
jgi:histidine triad (HIT) family protein